MMYVFNRNKWVGTEIHRLTVVMLVWLLSRVCWQQQNDWCQTSPLSRKERGVWQQISTVESLPEQAPLLTDGLTAPLSGQEITTFFLVPLEVLGCLLENKDYIITHYKGRWQVALTKKVWIHRMLPMFAIKIAAATNMSKTISCKWPNVTLWVGYLVFYD